MLNQEKTRPIDTSVSALQPYTKNESDDDLIYAEDSKIFQSISLSAGDVLTIRRENTGTSPLGLSVEELSLLSGIPTHDIACMENGSLPIDTQTAQKLARALDSECSEFML